MRLLLGVLLLTALTPVASPGEEAPPTKEKLTNTLKWSTASEVENFGYDVYRARSEEGPFERVTEEPILGAGTTDLPKSYRFVDDTIEPGVAYFYYVESISLSGARKRFTPVIRSRPKPRGSTTPNPESGVSPRPAPADPAPDGP